jgi:hypothetical protein
VIDSLTEHQAKVLANIMTTEDDLIQIHIPDLWEVSIKLSPSHPRTATLLQEAGVTASRLNTPLIHFCRHHHLATTEEMRQAFLFAEDRFQFNHDYPAGANWYDLMIERATPAGELLRGDTYAVEEPTMIVLNVGAHLREFELGANLLVSDYIEGLKNLVRPWTFDYGPSEMWQFDLVNSISPPLFPGFPCYRSRSWNTNCGTRPSLCLPCSERRRLGTWIVTRWSNVSFA